MSPHCVSPIPHISKVYKFSAHRHTLAPSRRPDWAHPQPQFGLSLKMRHQSDGGPYRVEGLFVMFPKPKNLISSPLFIRFNKARQGDLFISQNVLYFWRTVACVAVSSAQSGTLFRASPFILAIHWLWTRLPCESESPHYAPSICTALYCLW